MMMLPLNKLDPYRCANEKLELEGHIALSKMPRLKELINNRERFANARLQFAINDAGKLSLDLQVEAGLELTCQRSLESFLFPVDHTVNLILLEHDDTRYDLAENDEPVFIEQGLIDPLEIIEEELLLAMPMIPKKPNSICAINHDKAYYCAAGDTHDTHEQNNPFAILAKLKTNSR
jgi:uncharacterized protein